MLKGWIGELKTGFNLWAGLDKNLYHRFHDVNKNGWWFLIMFTGIGILLLIYGYLLPSEDEETEHLKQRPSKRVLQKKIVFLQLSSL